VGQCAKGLPVAVIEIASEGGFEGYLLISQFLFDTQSASESYLATLSGQMEIEGTDLAAIVANMPTLTHDQLEKLIRLYLQALSVFLEKSASHPVDLSQQDLAAFYGHFLGAMGDALFVVDMDTMRLIYANTAFVQRLGYPAGKLYTMGPELFSDVSHEKLEQIFHRLVTRPNETYRLRTQHRTAENRSIPVECVMTVAECFGHKVIVSSSRDITEELQRERHIQKGYEWLEILSEHLPIGFAITDANSSSFSFVSKGFEKIHGWPVDRFDDLHHYFESMILDVSERERILLQLLHSPHQTEIEPIFWSEQQIVDSKGEKRYLDGVVVPIGQGKQVLIAVWDVSEKWESLQALQKNATFLQELVENISDIVLVFKKDLVVDFVSPAMMRQFNVAVEDVYHYPFDHWVNDEDRERVNIAFNQVASGEAPEIRIEFRVTLPQTNQAEDTWLSLHLLRQSVSASDAVRILGVARNVSHEVADRNEFILYQERYQSYLQQLIDKKTTDLRAALRLAEQGSLAKSEFLANMSHELRTPLHAILSFADIGLRKCGQVPVEKLAHYYQRIQESGQRLLKL
jgi:PAS domain S-box-containing protein